MAVFSQRSELRRWWRRFLAALLFLTVLENLSLVNADDDFNIFYGIPAAYETFNKHFSDDQGERVKACTTVIEYILGAVPEDGNVDMEGLFSIFSQAYHFNYPAVDFWTEGRQLARYIRDVVVDAREVQSGWKEVSSTQKEVKKCKEALDSLNVDILFTCGSEQIIKLSQGIWVFGDLNKLANKTYIMCQKSVSLLLDSLYNSYTPTPYNGVHNRYHWSLFGNMLDETTRFDQEIQSRLYEGGFQDHIDRVRKSGRKDEAVYLEERLNEFKERLTNPSYPYKMMFFQGNPEASNSTWVTSEYGLNNFMAEINALRVDGTLFVDAVPYIDVATGKTRWEGEDGLSRVIKDIDSEDLGNFVVKIAQVYIKYLDGERIKQEESRALRLTKDKDGNNVVIGDGLWKWDVTKGIHNMRLAWELMGGFLEAMKCYMEDTYYFHLRGKVLQDTQRNLTEGALFSRVSQTMLFPCRIENDSDLVSPYCTAENNEICAPMAPFASFQRTDSEFHSVKTLLKPKWVYRYNKEAKRCWGRRDYVQQHYACRCGFRLDCGEDLGINITCPLIHSDLLRGQCRGNVAYPCKTLPLAPGKHHESCASGYCNMKENSCEDRPHILKKPSESGGYVSVPEKSTTGLLVYLGGLITGWIEQLMVMNG